MRCKSIVELATALRDNHRANSIGSRRNLVISAHRSERKKSRTKKVGKSNILGNSPAASEAVGGFSLQRLYLAADIGANPRRLDPSTVGSPNSFKRLCLT